MTTYIVFVAMVLSIHVIRHYSLEKAFLYVWIPFFILMPDSFYLDRVGFGHASFMQTAIIPILIVLFVRVSSSIRFGTMELLIAAYMIFRIVVDYLSRGYADAQNYTFFMLTSIAGPFVLGRYLIKSRSMDIATAKMIVLMFLIMFPMFLFELKYWVTPIYKLLSPLFPQSQSGLSLRYGIARVHGSYTHPILACIMVLIAYRLHRWLCWKGVWNQTQTGLLGIFQRLTDKMQTRWLETFHRLSSKIRIPMSSQISIMLLLVAMLTISRGPWLGGLFGAIVANIGRLHNSKRIVNEFIVTMIIVTAVSGVVLYSFANPPPGTSVIEAGAALYRKVLIDHNLGALSEEAGTVLYRAILVDRYIGFVLDHPWVGWGLTGIPRLPGTESVDNGFLLMALEHGLPAALLFITIFLYAIVSQIRFGMHHEADLPSLGFTFAGIYVMCFFAFFTVYVGAQTMPMLFLLLGWGESVIHRHHIEDKVTEKTKPFRHVIC